MSFDAHFEAQLKDIHKLGRKRELKNLKPVDAVRVELNGQLLVNFSSNSYLGLHADPEVKQASIDALEFGGASSGASRLVSGSYELMHDLECATAEWKQCESALVFNSGYQANLTLMQALTDKKTLVLADRLIHASLIDGVRLSGAKLYRYAHNDLSALDVLLQRYSGIYEKIMILSETVFSMDGDLAPLEGLADLAEEYKAFLYLDDAHGAAVFGEGGQGPADCIHGRVDVLMGTYSKGLGSFGAYACMKQSLKDYVVNTGRGFIFTTALPPAVIGANLKALELVQRPEYEGVRSELRDKARGLRSFFGELGLVTLGEDSPIIPIVVGSEEKALLLSAQLQQEGFLIPAIRPPTVPQDSCRLRLTLSAKHEGEQIEALKASFKRILKS